MPQQLLHNDQTEPVKQIASACQNAISCALAQPSRAIGLARGLSAAPASLQLVQSEVAKGEGGASAVTADAAALTRHALIDVLTLSSQPAAALAALAAIPAVASVAAPSPAAARIRTAKQVRAPTC
jgi:hypothetical protein